MNFLEKDLEEVIFTADKFVLDCRGLPTHGRMVRQLNLGRYGKLDLLTVSRNISLFEKYLTFTIYELKKDVIGISAFLQAISYAKGIQEFMETKKPKTAFNIEICLIGKTLDKTGSFCYLPDLLSYSEPFHVQGQITNVTFYTYHFDIDGFSFKNENGYYISNAFKK